MPRHYPRAPRLVVDVDAAQIEAAIPRDSSHCMIAEAIKAALPGMIRVSVDLQTIRFSDPSKRLRYVYFTPRSAQRALIGFDQGQTPEPFTMRLQGAQVTSMAKSSRLRESDEQHELSKRRRREQHQQEQLASAALTSAETGGGGTVPRKVGGTRPPLMTMARRRTFGLRGFDRGAPAQAPGQ